ncbi:signal peptidase II [Streptomyces sp. NBC_00038]|uniref:signal peptidase II n=1 Tax=Streptomyces sp. NBC_00038 TaxID=2903615 RepID=UPI00224DEDA3|nr:signal peptidase II [Streptomyces sp. NBC_00038]MCX5556967.1 signal peptidase II [Streptomyces sp. NBC_00038]
MAEAERIIGTPDIPGAAGSGPEQSDENAASGDGSGSDGSAPAEGSGADGTATPDERPRGKRRIAVLFAVAALAYVLDLVSKMIVVAKLEHHDSIEIIGDWLKFEAIRNAGAAFGLGEAFTIIFTVIAAAVIVVIARLARKLYSLPWAIALGLLLGGALGNLTDRIFRSPGVFEGAVVDFIAPKHFAVFNLADSAIVCGGILIVLLSFRGLDPDGTVHKD